MNVTAPGEPREVQDFQFKLVCRIRVFDQQDDNYVGSYNLLASASKYGLLFVGCQDKVQAILLQPILENEHPIFQKSRGSSHGGVEITNYPRRELQLPEVVSNLGVNCDQTLLAVTVFKGGYSHAFIYDVASFLSKETISLFKEIRLSSCPDAHVLQLSWNPGISNVLACCLSNGSVGVYEFKNGGVDSNNLPPEACATCFSWSPKGKQLVIGSKNGLLTQHKPDLKAVKSIPAPNVFEGPSSVLNILWISNYQFAAVYRDSSNENERPSLLIVNAPKGGVVSYVNFEDICYSSGSLRTPQFYLCHQANWNVIIVGSANSMEVGVLGLTGDQQAWEQWSQDDASRAELPLTSSKEETFPLGLCLDTSTQRQLLLGENQALPPMPVLALLSHRGVLCLFYAINILPGAPVVCSPPEIMADQCVLQFFSSTPTRSQASGLEVSRCPQQALPAISQEAHPTSPQQVAVSAPLPLIPSSPQQVLSNPPQQTSTTPTQQIPASSQMNRPLEWGTPVASVMDSNRLGRRINLTEKFDQCPQTLPINSLKLSMGTPENDTSKSASSVPTKFGMGPPAAAGTFFGDLGVQSPLHTNVTKTYEGHSTGGNLFATPGSGKNPLNFMFPAASSTPNLFGAKPLQIAHQMQQSPQLESQKSEQQGAPPNTNVSPNFSQPQQQPQQQQFPLQSPLSQSPMVSQFQVQVQQSPLKQISAHQETDKTPNFMGATGNAGRPNPENTLARVSNQTTGSVVDDENVDKSKKVINSDVLYLAIHQEMSLFEKEKSDQKTRLLKKSLEIGTAEEKEWLRSKGDAIDRFSRELQSTTSIHIAEVQALKSLLLESLAWLEDARSRAAQESDPCWLQVVCSEELDPVSARTLGTIKQLAYYFESQVTQVDRSLDLQWANFQESCRDKIKGRLYIPSLEAVYQAMVLQSNILAKQKANVRRIVERTAKHKPSKTGSLLGTGLSALQTRSDTDLAMLAENLLQIRLGASCSSVESSDISEIMAAGRYSMVASVASKLTPSKLETLREFLTQGSVRHTKPVKRISSSLKTLAIDNISKSHEVALSFSKALHSTPFDLDKAKGCVPESCSAYGSDSTLVTDKYRGIECDRTTPGDFLGHIAKRVESKFKESDSYPKVSNLSHSVIGGDVKHDSHSELISSSSNKQTLLSFSPQVNSSQSNAAASKNKGVPNFTFDTNSCQPVVENNAKSDSAGSFHFQLSTPTSAQSFVCTLNKNSGFNFFSPGATTTTTNSVQSVASASETAEPTSSSSGVSFAFGTTTTSASSGLASKTLFGPPLSTNTNVSETPSFGSTNISTPFSFSMNSALLTGQTLTKSVFGGISTKSSTESNSGDVVAADSINHTGLTKISINSGKGSSKANTSNSQTNQNPLPSTTIPLETKSAVGTVPLDLNFSHLSSLCITPTVPSFGGKSEIGEISTADSSITSSASAVASGPNISNSQQNNSFSVPVTSLPNVSVFGGKTHNTKDENACTTTVTFFGQPVCSPSSFTQNSGSLFGQKNSIFGGAYNTVSNVASSSISSISPNATFPSATGSALGNKSVTSPISSSFMATTSSELTIQTAATSTTASQGSIPVSGVVSSLLTPGTTTASTTVPATLLIRNSVTSAPLFGSSASVMGSVGANAAAPTSTPTSTSTTTAAPASTIKTASTTTLSLVTSSTVANNSNNITLISTAAASTTSTTTTTTTTIITSTPTSNVTSIPAAAATPSSNSTSAAISTLSLTSVAAITPTPPAIPSSPTVPTSTNTITTSSSVFGSGSMFGQATTSSLAMFKPQGTTTNALTFGQGTTTSITSVFGTTSTTSTSSLFGQKALAPTAFGSTTSGNSLIFGQVTTTTSGSLFTGTVTSSGTLVFGPSSPTATTISVFGQPTATTEVSVFSSPTTLTTTPVFGQTSSTSSTLFGQSSTTSSSVFGQTTTATPIFGQAVATTSAAPAFGSGSSAPSIFGQSSATTSNSAFGQQGSSSVFGGPSNAFGQPTGTFMGGSRPSFGGNASFGQSGGSLFAQSGTGFGSPGGSLFGGGSSTTNSGSTFGPTGNLFQSSATGSVFGGSPTNRSSTGGAFSAVQGQSIAESGFGSPSTFGQKSGGFGSPPAFGQSSGGSGFGGSPTFGGAPTFGGSPTFGSPNRVFGSTSPTSGSGLFGGNDSQQQGSSTFENLANQNTMTFGNLASGQSSTFGSSGGSLFGGTATSQTQQTPSFQSSFGGSSFSSWR